MASQFPAALRQYGAALRAFLALTVILGLAYPLVMTGIGQVLFNDKANGSIVARDGTDVGSSLIGQSFERQVVQDGQPQVDQDGNPVMEPDPMYFQSRPSAAGTGYDPLASSASNLGPTNEDLVATIEERRAAVAELNGVSPADVPADAVTASGSGLDPDISPEYADLQVARVARERGVSEQQVSDLVKENTTGRTLGFLGEPRVNVLELNLALDRIAG
jgi:K+-transporting ATPase ATPase C chain